MRWILAAAADELQLARGSSMCSTPTFERGLEGVASADEAAGTIRQRAASGVVEVETR
jgi:hypothetical protein